MKDPPRVDDNYGDRQFRGQSYRNYDEKGKGDMYSGNKKGWFGNNKRFNGNMNSQNPKANGDLKGLGPLVQ